MVQHITTPSQHELYFIAEVVLCMIFHRSHGNHWLPRSPCRSSLGMLVGETRPQTLELVSQMCQVMVHGLWPQRLFSPRCSGSHDAQDSCTSHLLKPIIYNTSNELKTIRIKKLLYQQIYFSCLLDFVPKFWTLNSIVHFYNKVLHIINFDFEFMIQIESQTIPKQNIYLFCIVDSWISFGRYLQVMSPP